MISQLARLAAPYADMLSACEVCCAERTSPSEAHLQALWNNDAHRPATFTLDDGRPVTVLEKGIWNHGDGPDFKNALLSINGCLQRGDIEIHCSPRDWDVHQHAKNPTYANVILHVTWASTPVAKTLPPQVARFALQPFFETHGNAFDFHQLSLVDTRDGVTPCHAVYAHAPFALETLLASAGYHRFLQKAQRFVEKSTTQAPFQVFYEGLLRAMGYQRNAETFTRLAKEIPFEVLEPFPLKQRFAVLAGVGGLLPSDARELWDLWWTSGCPPPFEPYAWDFRALRPQNHPYRRLAGGMGVLNRVAHLLELPLDALAKEIQEASNLLADVLDLKGALIGARRANALVNNLFVPYRLATGTLSPTRLNDLPGESLSAPMREVWMHLTGTTTRLPKDALRQQGLLQIYHDFCYNDHVLCALCPLAQSHGITN